MKSPLAAHVDSIVDAVGLQNAWKAVSDQPEEAIPATEKKSVYKELMARHLEKAAAMCREKGVGPEMMAMVKDAMDLVDKMPPEPNPGTPPESPSGEAGAEGEDPAVEEDKALWPAATVDELPDSAFLYVEPGGTKDADGKTTPRSLRHFPVRDKEGKVDAPHVRDALSRIPQSNVPQDAKDKAKAEAERLLAEAGGADAAKSLTQKNAAVKKSEDPWAWVHEADISAKRPIPKAQPFIVK